MRTFGLVLCNSVIFSSRCCERKLPSMRPWTKCPISQPTNGLLGVTVSIMTGLFTGSCAHFSRTLPEEHTEGSF